MLRKKIVTELLVYTTQVLIFALVTVFASRFFGSEAYLTAFLSARISDLSLSDFGYTLLAIAVMAGVISFIADRTASPFWKDVLGEIFNEFPRSVYLFGSSIAGPLLVAGVYSCTKATKPAESVAGWGSILLALLFAIVFFVCGMLLKAWPAKNNPGPTSGAPSQP